MPQRMSLFEEHSLAHLGYSLCAYEARSNGASEVYSSCRSASGDDVAVFNHQFRYVRGINQTVFKSGVAGRLAASQDSKVAKYHGGGANGGNQSLTAIVCRQHIAQAVAFQQV